MNNVTKSLASLKRGAVWRLLLGFLFAIGLVTLMVWLAILNRWWTWLLFIVIGPKAVIYTIKQSPRAISDTARLLKTQSEEEFRKLDDVLCESRIRRGMQAGSDSGNL